MKFGELLCMISYSQIIHFSALKPTVKKILSLKILIFYTTTAQVEVKRGCHSQMLKRTPLTSQNLN
jgi:hypothetical protein